MVGLDAYPKVSQWEGLRSIGMVQRECTIAEKTSVETRYFINSIKPEAKVFAHAVRSHWGVENILFTLKNALLTFCNILNANQLL